MNRSLLKSAKGTATELGLHPSQISRLYHQGVIDAEIHEGRCIRFDVEKVKSILAERAKAKRAEIAERIPEGMVPTL